MKNVAYPLLSRFTIALLTGLPAVVLIGCDNRPTATLNVVMTFDDCTTEYTTSLSSSGGDPVTAPAGLSSVSSETESDLGCDIKELEYAFNTSPMAGKIEFDVGDTGEVTAFVPLDNQTKPPQPFLINTPNFKFVSVKVSFPDTKVAPLQGSVQAGR